MYVENFGMRCLVAGVLHLRDSTMSKTLRKKNDRFKWERETETQKGNKMNSQLQQRISSKNGPAAFFLPFIDNLLDIIVVELRSFEFVPNDLLYLRVVESDNVLLESVLVHIRR